jgi:DNA-binding SARP family transcriptional activator
MLEEGKEVSAMESFTKAVESLAEKSQDEAFKKRVKKLKKWVKKNPYDFEAHSTLAGLYLSMNMFAEAELEQEIMEWLDRIDRSVRINT